MVRILLLLKIMAYMFTYTHFISSHFIPGSFRTQVISYKFGHFVTYTVLALLELVQRSFSERNDSVCLSVNIQIRSMFLNRYDNKKNPRWPTAGIVCVTCTTRYWAKHFDQVFENLPSGLRGDAIKRKCLQADGHRRDPPQKSSSAIRPDELMIREQFVKV